MVKVRITRANGTRAEFVAPTDRVNALFDAMWEQGFPVDIALQPHAPITMSLENGDFVARICVTDHNRDEYGHLVQL